MLFKQSFLHPLELIDFRLVAARYAASAVSALEVIFLPLILQPELYTDIEKNRQILTFLPIALLGASLGYVKLHFDNEFDNLESDLICGTIISSVTVSIFVLFFSNSFLFSISSLLFVISTSLERVVFAQGRLIWASLYKLFISASVIIIFSATHIFCSETFSISAYFSSVIMGCLFWLILVQTRIYNIVREFTKINTKSVSGFVRLVFNGVSLNILTYVLAIYFIFDRYTISKFFPASNFSYALSFSLSQIPIILLNTIAYTFLYKMGLNIGDIGKNEYKKYRLTSIIVFLISFILGSIGGYIYLSLINMIDSAYLIFLILNFFLGLYFALSAATGVALYLDLSGKGLAILLCCLAVNLALSPFVTMVDWSAELYVLKSGAILVLSALLLDRLIVARLDTSN